MSTPSESAITRIGESRILPVVRAASADAARDIVARLLGAGVDTIECTATTPDWPELVSELRAGTVDALIGVGTITTAANAVLALESGADFLVSPYPAPEVRPIALAAGVLFIEGGYTPGEVAAAAARGVAKLFPAHVGGVRFLKSLLDVLPGARIVPTGGITVADVPAWLAAGAFAVGVGSDLYAADDLDAKVAELRAAIGAEEL
jgi:2-dehydro-3-deoxyphosphogluconate aldolase/(4S)-4-hydroxy-2-oxoglutarate aldolase